MVAEHNNDRVDGRKVDYSINDDTMIPSTFGESGC